MSRRSIAAAADAAPAAMKIVAFMPRRIRYILAARDGNRSRERLVDKSVLSCRFSVVDNRAPTTDNCFQALSSVGRASPSHGGGRRFESGSAYQSRFAPLLRNSRLRNPAVLVQGHHCLEVLAVDQEVPALLLGRADVQFLHTSRDARANFFCDLDCCALAVKVHEHAPGGEGGQHFQEILAIKELQERLIHGSTS